MIDKLIKFWDFLDQRDIEKHVVAGVILYGTVYILYWSVEFAWKSPRAGADVALIISAVTAPWAILQGAIAHFYFNSKNWTP